ncbi:MAG: hypothetical protein KDD69_01015 [Bdellovibrionales bacterium]|nr:hypothetical protein [Bdellovibrionales bacterium]
MRFGWGDGSGGREAVHPWAYNPSAWSQRVPVALIATIGFFISTYLGLYQWRLIDGVWDPVFGDQTRRVLDSTVSEQMRSWFHLPDALAGAFGYLGDMVFALAGSTRRWQCRPWLVIIFGIDVIPLGIVSAVLVVLQGTTVGSWCFLCLLTAPVSIILIFFAYDEVWSSLVYLGRVWRRSRKFGTVWQAFVGRPSAVAAAVAREMQS